MSKKSKRPKRRDRHDRADAFGSTRALHTGGPARIVDPSAQPYPDGHPEQAQAWMLNRTAPSRCPKCGETPQFGSFEMNTGFGPGDRYGLPERATRQWIVENSEPDEFETVQIPGDRQDGLTTHATYWPDWDDIEDCSCHEDESVMRTLQEYSG